ncbi:hypothetical protein TREES_T100015854 [Tupaia chinensis]|uniref:Uncharacterized protein n=1 Tax=Tupaia chinensis TaxID=246437 RepID=L9L1D8_TUPCH|nr:hypothetical protein TREES_T100015854 [Tupaia chinensis]
MNNKGTDAWDGPGNYDYLSSKSVIHRTDGVPAEGGLCFMDVSQDMKRRGGLRALRSAQCSLNEKRCIMGTPVLIEDDGLDKCIHSCKTQSFLACTPSCSKCPAPEAHWAEGGQQRDRPEDADFGRFSSSQPTTARGPRPERLPLQPRHNCCRYKRKKVPTLITGAGKTPFSCPTPFHFQHPGTLRGAA